jgi:hypothetical protein
MKAAIPPRKDRRRDPKLDAESYRRQSLVERRILRLKQNRRPSPTSRALAAAWITLSIT